MLSRVSKSDPFGNLVHQFLSRDDNELAMRNTITSMYAPMDTKRKGFLAAKLIIGKTFL